MYKSDLIEIVTEKTEITKIVAERVVNAGKKLIDCVRYDRVLTS